MVRSISRGEIIAKASRGLIKNYYADDSLGGQASKLLKPTQNFDRLLSLMDEHTFNTEVNALVDGLVAPGWRIVSRKDSSKRDQAKELEFKRKFRGNRLLRQLYLNLIIYRNAFIEVVNKRGRAEEIHMLETTEMNINIDPHGEVLGYTQIHQSGPYSPKQSVFFQPNECIHISPSRITTNPWGVVDTQSLIALVESKKNLENYILDLFKKNSYRKLWTIEETDSSENVKNFIATLKEGAIYTDKDIVILGKIANNLIRDPKELMEFTRQVDAYENSIRKFLRVPPSLSGDGGDGKSTAEFEVRVGFWNNVNSWHKVVADEITEELFPKLGWSTHELVFHNGDVPSHKVIVEQAVNLKGLGFTDDTIVKFLIEHGIDLPEGAKIKTPEERAEEAQASMGGDNQIMNQKLQNMNASSRQPSDSMKVKQAVSEDKKVRDDQKTGK